MNSAQKRIPQVEPSESKSVKVLRENLDDEGAETLARRYKNADEAARTAVDWPTVVRGILNNRPKA